MSEPQRDQTVANGVEEEPYPSPAYAWYITVILMLIYVNSFMDRSILGLLVDPIRNSLNISEAQMGFVMGPAFALFYIFAGIPLGRLADTVSRRGLVFVGQLFWSLMSVGCGLVRTFPQFLALRMGLGVGEASLSPAAYSTITDLFPKNKLARALSVYGLGISIGAGLARIIGGLVTDLAESQSTWTLPLLEREVFPWQIVFFCVAAPTIPLSILLFTVKEPARRGVRKIRTADGKLKAAQVPLSEVLAYLRQNRATMLRLSLGVALLSFSGYGVGAWLPSHFIRNLGWTGGQVGIAIGVVYFFGGVLGMLFGGWLADRLQSRGVRNAKILVALISAVAWFPFGILYPLMSTGGWALLFFTPSVIIASMPWGVGPAAVQEIMPNKMRGQASAIYLFIVNMFGLGAGPYMIAAFTQYVFKDDSAVSLSILVVPVAAHLVSAVLLFFALEPFKESLHRLEKWNKENI